MAGAVAVSDWYGTAVVALGGVLYDALYSDLDGALVGVSDYDAIRVGGSDSNGFNY